MNEHVPVTGASEADRLARAQEILSTTTRALLAAINNLENEDGERSIEGLIRAYSKACQTALDLEISLEKRNQDNTAARGELDLDAARSEIGRRLARLRDAGGATGLS